MICSFGLVAGLVLAQNQAGRPAAPNGQPASGQELKTTKDKVSYGIGMNIGNTIKQQGLTDEDLGVEAFVEGLRDALGGKKSRVPADDLRAAFEAYQKELTARQEARQKQLAETNRKEGESFLAENKKRQGVKTLPSGLQYVVLKDGTGASPKATDTIQAHYRGKLINGEVFDESYNGEQPTNDDDPLTIQVDEVIKGWTEALQLMKVGSKWRLFLPSELAYKDSPSGPGGPNSVLVFDVELVGIGTKAE
ncbi:MAG TPA: FKBP-type peptidyl-prolyl cis-trans isomerase [Planctomycetaceae bacterium]|nr:FKBP-type peptidyl-prolyl cis-trans isomerase [Planctomycetaceae bacterium]